MSAPTQPAPRALAGRGVELLLLVCAVLVAVSGYAAVGLDRDGAVPPDVAGYALGLGVLSLLAHLVVRFLAPYADPLLLPIAVLLNGLGLVLIYRLDQEAPGDPSAPTQLVWSALGMALFMAVVVMVRDHRVLQRYAYLSVVCALALMIVPILFPAVNGAKIWIRIDQLSIQPGEFAKVLLALFFASYLAANHRTLACTGRRFGRLQLPNGRVLGPLVTVWLLSVVVLVFERDLGTSLLFFGVFVILLYVATGRTGWIAIGLLLAAVGAFAAGTLEPHVHNRVEDWLHPFASIDAGIGPGQLAQSLFAFAAGGITGTGLGLGHSTLIGFATKSDFILATAGEELGLLGLSAIFLLYGLMVARGLRTGLVSRDPFGRLLAVGLSSLLALQVFVIAGGVMGLIPLTGMAMPFLAQGGSSVVTNWVIVALLMRISDSARRPGPVEAREPVEGSGRPSPGGDSPSRPALLVLPPDGRRDGGVREVGVRGQKLREKVLKTVRLRGPRRAGARLGALRRAKARPVRAANGVEEASAGSGARDAGARSRVPVLDASAAHGDRRAERRPGATAPKAEAQAGTRPRPGARAETRAGAGATAMARGRDARTAVSTLETDAAATDGPRDADPAGPDAAASTNPASATAPAPAPAPASAPAPRDAPAPDQDGAPAAPSRARTPRPVLGPGAEPGGWWSGKFRIVRRAAGSPRRKSGAPEGERAHAPEGGKR